MVIRDATAADLPRIVEIYNATVPTRMVTAELQPTTVEARRPWFESHSPARHPLWVAEFSGEIAGWLSFGPFITRAAYRHTAEVSVYVDQSFRRQGIGRRLLSRAIERAPEIDLRTLIGNIFAHNEPSLALFESLGFERWGLLRRVACLDGIERNLVVVGRRTGKEN